MGPILQGKPLPQIFIMIYFINFITSENNNFDNDLIFFINSSIFIVPKILVLKVEYGFL